MTFTTMEEISSFLQEGGSPYLVVTSLFEQIHELEAENEALRQQVQVFGLLTRSPTKDG